MKILAYKQIFKNNCIGDSFFIRTNYNRHSEFSFTKGQILYVDNTLFNGIPGHYWRAWKVDHFGNKIKCGFIPSKYNPINSKKNGNGLSIFKFIPQLRRNSEKNSKYKKLNCKNDEVSNENILASYSNFPYTPSTSCIAIEDKFEENKKNILKMKKDPQPSLYQMVRMTKSTSPRPVIIFGPFSHIVISRLDRQFFKLFRCVQKKTQTMIKMAQIRELNGQINDQFISCGEKTSEFISIADLERIAYSGKHPIISVTGNSIDQFHQFNIYPIVFEIKVNSARQIKQLWNKKWETKNDKRKNQITKKMAKELYNSYKKIQIQFNNFEHFIINANENLFFICCKIKRITIQEQNRAIWCNSD